MMLTSNSAKMTDVIKLATRVAMFPASVLLTGESGVGKEVIANYIHTEAMRHTRKHGGFVAVNCGALPAHLLESELFGHIKGAFTGAYKHKEGLFLAAKSGTIMLDEIGDMPLEMQVKLLRCLETKEIRPVGSNKVYTFSARVIAATNQDLHNLISKGLFRKDLLYRINTVTIDIPPLRNRLNDIPILFGELLDEVVRDYDIQPSICIDRGIYKILQKHKWEGNIRELKNVVEQAVISSYSGEEINITKDVISSLINGDSGCYDTLFTWDLASDGYNVKEALHKLKWFILDSLCKTCNTKSEIAKKSKLSYQTIVNILKGVNLNDN
jgi:transcriptional regulator with PAS, ATPase and Fis domain